MVDFSPLTLIMGVAATFILLSGALFLKTFRFRLMAQQVDARLVKGEELGDWREDGLLAVHLSYENTAPDGRVIQADRTSLRWHILPARSGRTMLVDPEKPQIPQLPGIRENLVPVVLMLTGISILFIEILQL